MKLRPEYQVPAVEGALAEFEKGVQSTLIVLPTGGGKTVCFTHVGNRMPGRVMVIAHREELIMQAAEKVKLVTGFDADIEMAEARADSHIFRRSKFVVSSVQTLNAGRRKKRMERFDPDDFGLLIIDEAHHAPAQSYRNVIAHFTQNPSLKVLGVTATPERADDLEMKEVFKSVAFTYQIRQAVSDGYLVPVRQQIIHVNSVDFSRCKTTAGDLNGRDLEREMIQEKALWGVAKPLVEQAKWRRALVFASSVAHAERLAEILNRKEMKPGSARWICGSTPKDERKQILKDFAGYKFQFLVNVGVLTEGFDDPGVELIAVARPTKSPVLYTQIIGRGLRPLPGLVDGVETAEQRRYNIEVSKKPTVEIMDFTGNAGSHKLITAFDILCEQSEKIINRAKLLAIDTDGPVDLDKMVEEAEQDIERVENHKRQLAQRSTSARERRNIVADVEYSTDVINAFEILDVKPARRMATEKIHRKPSEKMVGALKKQGIKNAEELSFADAKALLDEMGERRDKGLCTLKQARLIKRYGYDPDSTFEEATRIITGLASNGWKPIRARNRMVRR